MSLDATFGQSNSFPLPLNGNDKIIAPFWADVDITRTGNIYYRQTTNSCLLSSITTLLRTVYPASGSITNVLIATWDAVGYYSREMKDTLEVQSVKKYT